MASFDENGKYIKTNWKAGDKITATKLNKIEESIEAVNDNDISRHVEADARLDALEAKDVAHDKEFINVRNLIAGNKAAAELGDYDINSRMTFLENELNEGIEEVHNVASTVDGKIAAADASMKAQVDQGKADMEAMVAEVEADLEGINSQLAHIQNKKFDIKDFGAKGDGVTDDTEAFIKCNSAMALYNKPLTFYIPSGEYIINPLLFPNEKYAIQINSDFSNIDCNGVIKIKKDVDYSIDREIGTEWYFAFININANNVNCNNVVLDGNGTATIEGYNSEIVNIRWEIISSFGTSIKYLENNNFTNCKGINIGGQAISAQYQLNSKIEKCYSYGASGMGYSVCKNSKIINCFADNSLDASFYMNGKCEDIEILNNVTLGTTNGSGIDCTGVINGKVNGNIIKNSSAWGLYVGYNVQNSNYSTGLDISENTFENNSKNLPLFACEILIGARDDMEKGAEYVNVFNNTFILNNTSGDYNSQISKIGYGASNIKIYNNKIRGVLPPSNNIFTLSNVCSNLEFYNNVWEGDGVAKINIPVVYNDVFKYYDNKNIDVSSTSVKKPNDGKGNFITKSYEQILSLSTSDTDVVTINFPTGQTLGIVEIIATQDGAGGILGKRYNVRGYQGVTSAVIRIDDIIIACGDNPPTITVDTSVNGVMKFKMKSVGNTRTTALKIKVHINNTSQVLFN